MGSASDACSTFRVCAALSAALICVATSACAEPLAIRVLAPPVLEFPLRQIAAAFKKKTGEAVAIEVEPSLAIERTVKQGHGRAIVITTKHRIQQLSHQKRIIGSTADLVTVQLVLAERQDSHVPIDRIEPGISLDQILGSEGKIAVVGGPDSAATARTTASLLGIGDLQILGGRILPVSSSRAAIDAVISGQAILAIAYDTDALRNKSVKTISTMPASSYPQLIYAAGATDRRPETLHFLRYLQACEAAAVFRSSGFGVIPTPGEGARSKATGCD